MKRHRYVPKRPGYNEHGKINGGCHKNGIAMYNVDVENISVAFPVRRKAKFLTFIYLKFQRIIHIARVLVKTSNWNIVVVAIVAITIVLAIFASQKMSLRWSQASVKKSLGKNDKDFVTNLSVIEERLSYVKRLIIQQRISSKEAFEDENSNQFMAMSQVAMERGIDLRNSSDVAIILQKYALLSLFYDTGMREAYQYQDGGPWRRLSKECEGCNGIGWGTSQHFCEWFGVSCDDSRIFVTRITLNDNGLIGTIPFEINGGAFPKLIMLDLSNNNLRGSIHSNIGSLTALKVLQLTKARLNTFMSRDLWVNMGNLIHIDLSHNLLTGSISTEFGTLSHLESFHLAHNYITGAIPTEIGSLSKLTDLDLGYLLLEGQIPSEIGNLTAMKNIFLNNNSFVIGTIPTFISRLINLRRLDFSGCSLTGTIPVELGSLTLLNTLDLDSNQLSGSIPVGVCRMDSASRGKKLSVDCKKRMLAQKSIGMIIEMYRDVVADFENIQTGDWNSLTALQPGEGSYGSVGLIGLEKNQSRAFVEEPAVVSMKEIIEHSVESAKNAKQKINKSNESIIWDDEDDIPGYFDALLKQCSESHNALQETSFQQKCWGFLHSLVNEPRCTVQLDSRFECKRDKTHKKLGSKTAKAIIYNHLDLDTINIVIIGAGPVGLQLANAFIDFKVSRELSSATAIPEIRIIIFENRVISPGRKYKYTRDWIIDIHLKYLILGIGHNGDRRIIELCEMLSNPYVHLPMNALETLLLLSLRQRGVKFVYEDYNQYESILQGRVSNLVVFDASGNRLHELAAYYKNFNRTKSIDDDSVGDNKITVMKWDPSEILRSDYPEDIFHISDYGNFVLQENKALVQYSEDKMFHTNDPLLYPIVPQSIEPKSHPLPFATSFLKISDIRIVDGRVFEELEVIMEQMKAINDEDMYSLCDDNNEKHEYFARARFCRRSFVWGFWDQFRDDIRQRMEIEHPGFSHTCAFINLSSEQANAYKYMLSGLEKYERKNLPIKHLPIDAMRDSNTFQRNNFFQVLEFLSMNGDIGADYPTIELFEYRPYFFKEPLMPPTKYQSTASKAEDKNSKDVLRRLRIGDALFVGNPNRSTGLRHHAMMIKKLHEILLTKLHFHDESEEM